MPCARLLTASLPKTIETWLRAVPSLNSPKSRDCFRVSRVCAPWHGASAGAYVAPGRPDEGPNAPQPELNTPAVRRRNPKLSDDLGRLDPNQGRRRCPDLPVNRQASVLGRGWVRFGGHFRDGCSGRHVPVRNRSNCGQEPLAIRRTRPDGRRLRPGDEDPCASF